MVINFVLLDKEKYKDLKVVVSNLFVFVKNMYFVVVIICEFV